MRSQFLIFIMAALVMVMADGCQNLTSDTNPDGVTQKKEQNNYGDKKLKYNIDGSIAAEMYLKDGKLNGPAIKYYERGKIKRSELFYDNGQLEGLQKRYYKSGKLYKEENFHDGKRHGLTKKYRENGNLMSEAIYKNGFPGTELKEYLTNGKLKKKYPKIIIKEEESLRKNGAYTIRVFLSDKTKNVKFYLGKLDEGKFLHEGLAEQYDIDKGVLTYTFYLSPGDRLEQHFDFVARTPTRLNNTFITTRSYTAKIRYPH